MCEVEFRGKFYNDIDENAQRVLSNVGIYTFRFFPKDKVWMASDYSAKFFGINKFYLINGKVNEGPGLISKMDEEKDHALYTRILEGEERVCDIFHSKDGKEFYKITLAVHERDENGAPEVISGVLENVTDQKYQNEMLKMLADDYYSVFAVDFEEDVVYYTHRIRNNTNVDYRADFAAKPSYKKMIAEYIRNEVVQDEQLQMYDVTSVENIKKQFKKKEVYMHDFRAIRANGRCEYIRIKMVNASEPGRYNSIIIGFSNVNREHIEEWQRLAFKDPITSGRNFNYYSHKLLEAGHGYVVSMDIKDFKIINNVCGMLKGDEILKEVSVIVEHAVAGKGFYGHLNADHFVFYVNSMGEKDVVSIIEEITKEVAKLVQKEDIPKISPYFGVTKWIPGSRNAVIFSEASAAKHRIKETLENNYGFYRIDDDAIAIEKKKIEDAFEGAIENKEFEIWYQPKYTPLTGEITGAEALIRWRKPDGSLVPPGSFIPVYEKNGMIRALDEYVFKSVLDQQGRWLEKYGRTVPISINLSRASLYHTSIVEEYSELASRANIETKIIPIEITETATVNNSEIKALTDRFYEAGFLLYIDDFGAGYSSLATLNMMKIDALKLDKSLIDYIGEDGGNSLIKCMIGLAKELGIQVTAEGVETKEQLDFLTEVDCDSIQGYYYSKPLEAEAFEKLLASSKLDAKFLYAR